MFKHFYKILEIIYIIYLFLKSSRKGTCIFTLRAEPTQE
nr:MAG TPA: hypothetical protein [Bacteriophage sp.]